MATANPTTASPRTATFADLAFRPRGRLDGVQATAFFPNGYGVSVIRGFGTYGNEAGLYELAVAKGTKDDWSLCYDTPVTSDVEGHLSEDDVTRLLAAVEALPPVKATGADQ